MKALVQCVNKTKVTGNGAIISLMGPGLVLYLGFFKDDTEKEADYIIDSVMNARLFEEPRNDTPKAKPVKWSRNVMEKGYEVTCLAEISLAHDLKGGTPSFTDAMEIDEGQKLYEYMLDKMRNIYDKEKIKQSKFMGPHLVDVFVTNGVTLYLDTADTHT